MSEDQKSRKNKYNVGGICGIAAGNATTNIDVKPAKNMRVLAYSIRYSSNAVGTIIDSFRTAQDQGDLIIENAALENFGAQKDAAYVQHPCYFELPAQTTARMRIKASGGGLSAGDVTLVLHGELI